MSVEKEDRKNKNRFFFLSEAEFSSERFYQLQWLPRKVQVFFGIEGGLVAEIMEVRVIRDAKMEKLCEFCVALRPVIYCKADAAHLCLSCDAKVHSANALSNRHFRTLLCELCKTKPTLVHCSNHQMFLCHVCDQALHKASSHHQRRAIRSYIGCPSAQEFARFWGFDSTEFERKAQGLFLPSLNLHSSSLTHHQKIPSKSQDKGTSIILRQIFDLERLQLTNENNKAPLIRGEEKNGVNSSETIEEVFYQDSPNSQHFRINIRQKDNPLEELNADPLCFPFSQPEFLPSSSAVVNGESLWQYKTPFECSQLWSQNMQDLGVCDDFVCHDDFDIPDVDLTFRNFEELFGGDQDQAMGRLDDKDLSLSSVEKDMSPGGANKTRKEDASMASSGRGTKSSYKEKKSRRLEQQIECSSKRWRDEFQTQVKGRSEKTEGYASAKLDAARSF